MKGEKIYEEKNISNDNGIGTFIWDDGVRRNAGKTD